MTQTGLSAGVQHLCCTIAEKHPGWLVRCNNLAFDKFQRRWQLATRGLLISHLPGGQIAD